MKQEITLINDQVLFIEALSIAVREIVREELLNPKVKVKNKMEKEAYLTYEDVCEYLHVSRSTLYRLVNLGTIKCYKINKRCLFKLQEINTAFMKVSV